MTDPVPATPPGQAPAATPKKNIWGYPYGVDGDFVAEYDYDRYGTYINPGIIQAPPGSPQLFNLPDHRPERYGASAALINQRGDWVGLWVTEFNSDFQINGTTAQSRGYREFYPRSFNQPMVRLTGNCANDFQLNRLAEFVHQTQVNYLTASASAGPTGNDPTSLYSVPPLQLAIIPKKLSDNMTQNIGSSPLGDKPGNSNVPGWIPDRGHIGWLLQGFIEHIEAGGRKFNQAPEFTFNFNVVYNSTADGSLALYTDVTPLQVSQEILNWMDIIKTKAFTPTGKVPDPGRTKTVPDPSVGQSVATVGSQLTAGLTEGTAGILQF